MKGYIFTFILLLSTYSLTAQVYNPIPQYVFKNKLGVGRSTAVDSSAYMNIGPNGGATAGVVLPRIADTLSILGTKRHGLLIFANQLNKFAWWDSTSAIWTEVGSGSLATGGEVLLRNGSSTVGDSLLVSSITGDTAFFRNILAGSGLLIEPMGDTVLKLNIDSSTAFNIYNSDGTISGSRTVTVDGDSYFISNTDSSFIELGLGTSNDGEFFISLSNQGANSGRAGMSVINNGIYRQNFRPTLNLYAAGGIKLADMTDGSIGYPDEILPYYGSSDTSMYWNPSTGQVQRATVGRSVTTKANSANATLALSDNYVILSDLTGAASRTVTMPTGATGKEITIINKSSDGSLKWTFASTVTDISGATVTAIDDLSSYTLLYDGSNWIIINKY